MIFFLFLCVAFRLNYRQIIAITASTVSSGNIPKLGKISAPVQIKGSSLQANILDISFNYNLQSLQQFVFR